MRTEQFERGYDSCRGCIQGIIGKHPELRENEELMKLAQYPYYENDGMDWHPECEGCKHWGSDMDSYWCCLLDVDIVKIDDKCDKREVLTE